jgi:hypothetical protein
MHDWYGFSINDLIRLTQGSDFWQCALQRAHDGITHPSFHLAVFVEPFLRYVLEGQKTVESRFGIRKFAPYEKASNGDIIILKAACGPVVGLCCVSNTWYYQLDPSSWQLLRKEFTVALCAQDPDFWERRKKASYASLIKIGNVCRIEPISITKRDRRSWVILPTP